MTFPHRMLAVLALVLAPQLVLHAQDNAGYVGPGSQPSGSVSVQSLMSAKDGKDVVLRGHIVRQIDDEHYLFDDGTGQIAVEIDRGRWKKQQAGAQTPVELTGEVDIHHKIVGVEVKKVRLLTDGKNDK